MSEIINFTEHAKNKNDKRSNQVMIYPMRATDEHIKIFSENILKELQEWVSSKKDENITCVASIILTSNGVFHCMFDGVDDTYRLALLGGLDMVKSNIKDYIIDNWVDNI